MMVPVSVPVTVQVLVPVTVLISVMVPVSVPVQVQVAVTVPVPDSDSVAAMIQASEKALVMVTTTGSLYDSPLHEGRHLSAVRPRVVSTDAAPDDLSPVPLHPMGHATDRTRTGAKTKTIRRGAMKRKLEPSSPPRAGFFVASNDTVVHRMNRTFCCDFSLKPPYSPRDRPLLHSHSPCSHSRRAVPSPHRLQHKKGKGG